MRSNYRHGRGSRSRDSYGDFADAGRRRYEDFDSDYDLEDYDSYGGDEYDEEGRLRGGYEGEYDEFEEEYEPEDYDYSVAGGSRRRAFTPMNAASGRNRFLRGSRRPRRGIDRRAYRSTADRGRSSGRRGFASMRADREREINAQGARGKDDSRSQRGGWW